MKNRYTLLAILAFVLVTQSGSAMASSFGVTNNNKNFEEDSFNYNLGGIKLKVLGTVSTGYFDVGAAEIVAHDPKTQRLFFANVYTNEVGVTDISNPGSPRKLDPIKLSALGAKPNSVAVKDGLVAVAIENLTVTNPGVVAFFDTDGIMLGHVQVGALPDMLTFTQDGSKVLVANEGEPAEGVDPDGSVSIIDISYGVQTATVHTADFTAFDGKENELRRSGVRIFTGKKVSQDVEPEYIAISPDGSQAFVTLQEANAIAIINISSASVEKIFPLGVKDHNRGSNGLDASDNDGAIRIKNYPIFGLFMPDGIASFVSKGQAFYATANEGDDRGEKKRVNELKLDPTAYPNAAILQRDDMLGRLYVSSIDGDVDGDGDFDQLFSYGARSFSIRDSLGKLVFDSGNDFERITAEAFPDFFNSDNNKNTFDTRSDDKGPEPEAMTIGQISCHTYAFIGLERTGGIMVYDVTYPKSAKFVQYVNNRNFTAIPSSPDAGDLGVEEIKFISAANSPTGTPLLVTSNEVSGTITILGIFGKRT